MAIILVRKYFQLFKHAMLMKYYQEDVGIWNNTNAIHVLAKVTVNPLYMAI